MSTVVERHHYDDYKRKDIFLYNGFRQTIKKSSQKVILTITTVTYILILSRNKTNNDKKQIHTQKLKKQE